jgi:hypothetical protein
MLRYKFTKHSNHFAHALCLAALTFSEHASARQPTVSVKVHGTTFIEAPPTRDKNLLPFGLMNSQEKVEINAILSVPNGVISDSYLGFGSEKGDVQVFAINKDKSTAPLGSADIGSFSKTSADKKHRALSLTVNRLPDKPVQGILFTGTVAISIAKSLLKMNSKFEPTVGKQLKFGDTIAIIQKIDGTALTIKGNGSLNSLSSLSVKLDDGRVITGERRSLAQIANETIHEWSFSGALAAGNATAEIYDGLAIIKVPIDISVLRPY